MHTPNSNIQTSDLDVAHSFFLTPLCDRNKALLSKARDYVRYFDGSLWGRLGPRHPGDPWVRYENSPLTPLLAVRELSWEGDADLSAEDAVQAVAMLYAFPERAAPEPRG